MASTNWHQVTLHIPAIYDATIAKISATLWLIYGRHDIARPKCHWYHRLYVPIFWSGVLEDYTAGRTPRTDVNLDFDTLFAHDPLDLWWSSILCGLHEGLTLSLQMDTPLVTRPAYITCVSLEIPQQSPQKVASAIRLTDAFYRTYRVSSFCRFAIEQIHAAFTQRVTLNNHASNSLSDYVILH